LSGFSNEFFFYDRNNLLWTDISATTQGIIPRAYCGFAGSGEKLYLHSGFSNAGITLGLDRKLESSFFLKI
jgi:hypothetical protein